MDQFEFIRRFCEKPQGFAWLLGAGASRQANLPTATDVIDDLKRRYYCSEENQQLTTKDLQNDAVRARVDAFMEARGFPARRAPDEYTAHFEKIFGEDRERQRAYLSKMLSEERVSLAIGNRVMGALLANGTTRVVFTTNFDTIVEKSVAEVAGKSLSAYHLEGSAKANDALNNEEFPLYVKLHGDFRYESVKNLAADLKAQNDELSRCLINVANRFGFVAAGYSGRDASVMSLLASALESNNPYPHGIYWLGMKGSAAPTSVSTFLEAARKKGITAEYIETETFDTIMLRIWRALDNRPEDLDKKVRKAKAASVSIPLPDYKGAKPLLRYNALPVVSLPDQCNAIQFRKPMTWECFNDLMRDSENDILATLDGGTVWCWGPEEDAREAFGTDIQKIEPATIPTDWRQQGRLHVQRFLEDAIAKGFERTRPVLSRRRGSSTYLIVERNAVEAAAFQELFEQTGKTTGLIPGLSVPPSDRGDGTEKVFWSEAVKIDLAVADGRNWLLLTPDVWITPLFAREHATEWLSKRRTDRQNAKHDALVSAWAGVLMEEAEPGAEVAVTAYDGESSPANPEFVFTNRTGFSWRRR